mgnify:CR=1 FL=1
MSEEKATVSSSEQKKNKKVIVALSGTVAVLAVAVGVMAVSLLNNDESTEKPTDGRATFVSQDNVEEIQAELNKPVEDAYYTTSMTIDWEFHDGKSASTTAEVSNVTANTRTVYFDVNLESTGELVYSSPYLPVGSTMNGIILDVDLDKGDYPAVVTYHLVDDEKNEVATVAVAITIHVLN